MNGNQVSWQDVTGKRVTVHAPAGSPSAAIAQKELEAAEQAVAAVEDVLRPPSAAAGEHVEIFLADPIEGPEGEAPPPGDIVGEKGIVRIVRPDGTGDLVTRPVARLLIEKWFGPKAAGAEAFVEGVAGLAAARIGVAPDVDECNEYLKSQMMAGAPISILGGPEGLPEGFEGGPGAMGPGGPGMGGGGGPMEAGFEGDGPPPGFEGPPPGMEGPPPGMGGPPGGFPPPGGEMGPPPGPGGGGPPSGGFGPGGSGDFGGGPPPGDFGPGGPPGGFGGPGGPPGGDFGPGGPPGGDFGPGGPPGFGPGPADGVTKGRAYTSFVAYLVKSHGGADALRSFLESYEPERRDEAAIKVYQQPLASLEESWMSTVARGKRGDTAKAAFKWLFPLIKPHKLRYAEVLVYQFLTMLLTLALPLTSGCVVGSLSSINAPPGTPAPHQDGFCNFVAPRLTTGRLVAIVLVLILVYVVEAAVGIRKTYAENRLFQGIGADLQEKMFRHLQRLPHSFYSGARVGDITSRLSRDMEMLQGSLDEVFGNGVQMSISAVGAAVTAVLKSPIVGAIVFLIIPVFIASYKVLGARIADTSFEVQELTGEVMATSQENLSAYAVVKAFGLEERVAGTFRARVQQLLKKKLRLNLVTQFFTASINMAVNLGQMIVLGVGGYLVIKGTISDPGTLVTLLLLLPSVFVPIAVLADVGQSIQTASGSVERVSQVFDEPVEIEDKPDAGDLAPLANEIKLEDIAFGYSDERMVLDGLNLSIPAGKNVAIVGPSGSGKSTIVNLLMRFWDPKEGRVLFDGHDVRDVTLASLRGQIGIVFQDTFVFNSTLRDNIAIGRLGATDAEIEAAARAAQLDSYVEQQPAGYDTVLGERGVRMSGGQRQRLAIARALLRDPAILILDEATSALDANTEAEILETLAHVVKSRTTITITHRLAMAAMADIVVVLDQGKVAEIGPHRELVKAGGLYQRLYEEQTGKPQAVGRPELDLETALKKIPLFSNLSATALESLAGKLVLERYGEGSPVVRQGDAGDKLYVIKSGGADVLVNDGHNERRVNTLQASDYFGEYALLAKDRRTATVVATSPMEVWALSKDDFDALLKKESTLKRRVTKLVKDRRAAYDAAAEAAGIATRLSA